LKSLWGRLLLVAVRGQDGLHLFLSPRRRQIPGIGASFTELEASWNTRMEHFKTKSAMFNIWLDALDGSS
jgi:hypothetical protein